MHHPAGGVDDPVTVHAEAVVRVGVGAFAHVVDGAADELAHVLDHKLVARDWLARKEAPRMHAAAPQPQIVRPSLQICSNM